MDPRVDDSLMATPPRRPDSARPGWRRRALIAPLLVAVLIRLAGVLWIAPHVLAIGDSNGYLHLAREIRESGEFIPENARNVRPPGYVLLISFGLVEREEELPRYPGVHLDHFPFVYLVQIVFDVGAGALLMAFAARRFSRRVASLTGWIYALHPVAVLYAATLVMAEPVAAFCTALLLYLLQRLTEVLQGGRLARVAGTALLLGAAFALAAQVKGLLLLVVGSCLVALLLERGAALRLRVTAALLALAVMGALLAPWTAYTRRHTGIALPTGSYGHMALMYDNLPEPRNGYLEFLAEPDMGARVRKARHVFLHDFLAHPSFALQRAGERLRVLAGPSTFLPITVVGYGFERFVPDMSSVLAFQRSVWRLPEGTASRLLQLLLGAVTWLFFSAAFAGLVAARREPGARFVLALLGITVLTVALTVSMDRYRHMLLPALTPFAALALAMLVAPAERRARPARSALLVALATAALLALTLFVLDPP